MLKDPEKIQQMEEWKKQLPDNIRELSIEEKKPYVVQLKQFEASYRQISELTGLDNPTIALIFEEFGLKERKVKPPVDPPPLGSNITPLPLSTTPPVTPPKFPVTPQTLLPKGTTPYRVLDESYAQAFSYFGQKLSWFGEAINDIGFYSLILAFQVADIPTADVFTKLDLFKDASQFVSFVKTYLGALYAAKDEAFKIVQAEEYKAKLNLIAFLQLKKIQVLEKQRDMAFMNLRIALACMCRDCATRYSIGVTFSQMEGKLAIGEGEERGEEEEVVEVGG